MSKYTHDYDLAFEDWLNHEHGFVDTTMADPDEKAYHIAKQAFIAGWRMYKEYE